MTDKTPPRKATWYWRIWRWIGYHGIYQIGWWYGYLFKGMPYKREYPTCGWYWCGYPHTHAEQYMDKCPRCGHKNYFQLSENK